MRPKEYWETRPYPKYLHHWTPEEFEKFLYAHRYPANTIKDRLAQHRMEVCNSLMAGAYVPRAVLDTDGGKAALAEACMFVRAMDEAARKEARLKEDKKMFSQALNADFSVEALLIRGIQMLSEAKAKGVDASGIDIPGYPNPVRLMLTKKYVQFKDGSYHSDSLYGVLFQLPRHEAESIIRENISKKQLTQSDVSLFLGSDWMPFLRVQHCATWPVQQ